MTFVLLGVASPSALIRDTSRTPFNISYRVVLTNFTFEEAKPLAHGLGATDVQCEQSLRRILYWTGGHPYLTQKICQRVVVDGAEWDEERIDSAVEAELLSPQASLNDSNLNFVRDRMTKNSTLTPAMLNLYYRIRRGQKVVDDTRSLVHSELKLSGLIVQCDDRTLRVCNRVYKQVFTSEWVTSSNFSLQVVIRLERITKGELEKTRRVASIAIFMFIIVKFSFIYGLVDQKFLEDKFLSKKIVESILLPNVWPWWQITLAAEALLTFTLLFYADAALARIDAYKIWSEKIVLNTVNTISYLRAALGIVTISYFFYIALNIVAPNLVQRLFGT